MTTPQPPMPPQGTPGTPPPGQGFPPPGQPMQPRSQPPQFAQHPGQPQMQGQSGMGPQGYQPGGYPPAPRSSMSINPIGLVLLIAGAVLFIIGFILGMTLDSMTLGVKTMYFAFTLTPGGLALIGAGAAVWALDKKK